MKPANTTMDPGDKSDTRAMPTRRPALSLSLGCPSGIGPEVAVAAAARATEARIVLVGDERVILRAAALFKIEKARFVFVEDARSIEALEKGQIGIYGKSARLDASAFFDRIDRIGRPGPGEGLAQLAWIDQATDLVQSGLADALVTGPVSKHAIATSGAASAEHFLGHTEHLAERLGAPEVVMAFHSAELSTSLVTTHLPLARVPASITPEGVARTIYWHADLLCRLGARRPKLAVAALNPHAGEGGLLGDEERTRIGPGIELGRERLAKEGIEADVTGPIGAETAIRLAARGDYDGAVTMYHDQATIPSKLLGFGEAVNVTLGLPIVRTSVDHGTGYDKAGKGEADARGMYEAILLAVRLARR